jgi:hypothetical protein
MSALGRPFRALRRNIGRKLTALALGLLLWGTLQNFVIDDQTLELDVRTVSSVEQADRERRTVEAVYLVVPPDTIVRDLSAERIRVKVEGLRDEVGAALGMSAVLELELDVLGTLDETTFRLPLERGVFKGREGSPNLTNFRVRPETLSGTLARTATAQIPLTHLNVTMEGRPRDGYYFLDSSIDVRPNEATVTGPRAVIDAIKADPALPKLTPVKVGERSTRVIQLVGLPQELLDRGVRLQTPGGQVEVSIPIVPEDTTVNLFSVPVRFLNEDVIATSGRQIVARTEALDVRVVGPTLELDRFTPQSLADAIHLVFDWRDATQVQARPKVRVFLDGLSDGVRVLAFDTNEAPIISYELKAN